MSEKQKEFLKEFHNLCRKYSIDRVTVYRDSILFESNGQTLEIDSYYDGNFVEISTTITAYTIEEEKIV